MKGNLLSSLIWLAMLAGAAYLIGWSMNLWAALGWQSWSL
jgi:hypothetical protein